MMSQFVAAKNPPWARANAAGLVQTPNAGNSILTAQQISHVSGAGLAAGTGLGPGAGLVANAALAGAGLAASGPNPLATAAAVVAAAQNQQAQQGPAVSASYGTGLAAITLTQSALQQGAMLQQQGIAIPASLAATTQVANVNNGMVVEIARLPQPGVALPTSLATTQVATVSYPAPRLLAQTNQYQGPQPHPHQAAVVQQAAAAAVVQQHNAQQQAQHQQQQQQYKQRVFTGTVTKLHENFGFVDEDVFFQISSVKGNLPKAGERVLVEAAYNSNSPFKWNATRIQVLPNQVISNQVVQLNVQQTNANRSNMGQPGPLTAVVAAPVSMGINVSQNMNMNAAIANMTNNQNAFSNVAQTGRWQVQQEMSVMESLGQQQQQQQQQQQRLAMQHNNQHQWIQEMEYNEMMDAKGARMSSMVRRHNSPPPIRRDRERERDLRRDDRRDRYIERDRYIPPPRKRSRSPRRASRSPPRRRQRVVPRYTVQIPKISLDLKTGSVMELRKRYSNLYIPSDFCAANFLWQDAFPPHRPFSMDHQCSFHIIGKDSEPLLETDSSVEPPDDVDYTYSAKVMLMSTPALSEIFHKSCALAQDNDDAKENYVHPTRLISFLVGLKGKNETVAIGGPWSPSLDGPNPDKDPQTLVKTAIRTCKALTAIDLGKCSQWYRFAEINYRRGESHKGRGLRTETVVLFLPDVWSCLPTRLEWDGIKQQPLQNKEEEQQMIPEEDENNAEVEKKEPTHHSELDPKTIKVNDLKRELEARNLSIKGLKSQLIARLTKALKTESEKESEEKASEPKGETKDAETMNETEDEEKKKEKDEEKKTKEDKEKTCMEKRNLPDSPAILVQPSRTAKNGKFDCTVMSLSLLLDYRQEDNKEHSFEVSLFAELFNEMMMRDFGFRIYRSLIEAPEIKDDEKDKKKSDKKDDKKDRKDDKDDSRRKEDSNENESDKEDDDSEDDDYDDDKRDKDRKKRKKKKSQMCTHDPYLLLSFVYYDQTHCGYLLEKDIEEIFYTLGLMLSRAQVRKQIQKVCKRELFRYRKLTDRPLEGEKPSKSDLLKLNLEDLAAGNKKYIPSLKFLSKEIETSNIESKDDGSNHSMISYQGALVDVGKLMEQLERSEKARLDTDEKVKALQLQLDNLNETATLKDKQAQKLSLDLEDHKQKLRSAEEDLKRTRSETDRYHRTLCSLKEGLQSSLFLTDSVLQRNKRSRDSLDCYQDSKGAKDSIKDEQSASNQISVKEEQNSMEDHF